MKHLASQFLFHLGNELYVKDRQILPYVQDYYEISRLKSFINLGVDFIDESEEKEYRKISYTDLERLGFIIAKKSAKGIAWKKRQRRVYFIAKKGSKNVLKLHYDAFRNMSIEHDPFNKRIRLLGENVEYKTGIGGVTEWIHYDRKKKPFRKVYDSYTDMSQEVIRGWRGLKRKDTVKQEIPEIPLMKTEDNYLLCLPYRKILPKILSVGMTGKGKSFFINSLLGRIFYKFEDRIGFINDSLDQFYNLGQPTPDFLSELRSLGEEPKPLPTVNLYLSTRELKLREEVIDFKLTLSFYDFLSRYKFFTYGIQKWQLGGPEKYLQSLKKKFIGCKTAEDIKKTMLATFKSKDKTIMAMIYKWSEAFSGIFSEKFTDNVVDDSRSMSSLTLKKSDGETITEHPFIILMEAGLIPVLNSSYAKTKPFFRNYLADLMERVLQWQVTRRWDRKRIWLVADELNDIEKKRDLASERLREIFTQGRVNEVGFLGNTQSYLDLHSDLQSNVSHLFCLTIQTKKERDLIRKNYLLSKEQADELSDLSEFEMLAVSREPWIVYDKYGRRKVIKGRTFRGKVIPPISFHYSPK